MEGSWSGWWGTKVVGSLSHWVGAQQMRIGEPTVRPLGACEVQSHQVASEIVGLTVLVSTGLRPVSGTQRILTEYLVTEGKSPTINPPSCPPLIGPARHFRISEGNLGDWIGSECDSVSPRVTSPVSVPSVSSRSQPCFFSTRCPLLTHSFALCGFSSVVQNY